MTWTCINCSWKNDTGGWCLNCGTSCRATEQKNVAMIAVKPENVEPVESRFRSRARGADGTWHDETVQTFPDGTPWG